MFIDPLQILKREGIQATSYTVLAKRTDHLVIKVITSRGTLALKANKTPSDTTWDAINAKLLAKVGIPTPEIIAQAENPCSYVITRWIKGTPLSSESPIKAQIEAGQILRTIHTFNGRPAYKHDYTWEQWMNNWLEVNLHWWRKQHSVTNSMVHNAQASFNTLRPMLRQRGDHFMLQDGRPEHFIVRGDRIAGLIDVHDAQPGDGVMDLGVIGVFHGKLLQNMQKGYDVGAEEKAQLKQLVPFYIFLRRLAGAEWHMRNGSVAIAQQALSLATQYPLKRD